MTDIYYLGPHASFSYSVAKENFPDANLIPQSSFLEIMHKIKEDKSALGVFPITNRIIGEIKETSEIIKNFSYINVLEVKFRVSMCLMAKENETLDTIKFVYSKDAALSQCKKFIEKNKFNPVASVSTSDAAEFVSSTNEKGLSCIGHKILSNIYDLIILAEDVQDIKDNWTIFYFIKAL